MGCPVNVNLNEHELTSALAAVTDALDRVSERMMRGTPPKQYIRDHFANLTRIREKLSEAYERTDL